MKFKDPIAIKELAGLVEAEFSGDAGFLVSGINEIHQVDKGDVTFVDHPKYFRKALTSSASVIIVNSREIENPLEKILIFSDDPFRDYNRLVRHFYSFKVSSGLISETAEIGDGTVIQPNVFIGDQVIIGNNCIIHPNVTIYDNCLIGNNVIIHANTVIGSDAFYFQRKAEEFRKMNSCGRVIVEDNVEIGSNCSVDRGVSGDTVIGWGTKMDNLIQIGHDTVIGKNCLIASQVGVAGCVIIEDDVVLWGQVGVHKDLTIGKGAVVLAKSGVPKSLEGDKVYFGSPVQESREKMKELAYIKRIPDLLKLLSEKDAG